MEHAMALPDVDVKLWPRIEGVTGLKLRQRFAVVARVVVLPTGFIMFFGAPHGGLVGPRRSKPGDKQESDDAAHRSKLSKPHTDEK
jgi:hypothetical protein